MAIFARIGTMKVYYYHTIDTVQVYADWQAGRFPGHFLYGATHLPKYGIDVVFHRPIRPRYRWMLTLHTAWRILTCRTRFDAIYATTFRGMEILISLRALRLYRKPIFVWHHQPVRRAKNPLREFVARLFYRGMDHLFFFSDQLLTDSLRSSKAQQARMSVARWGADLDYYDRLTAQFGTADRRGFISTGRELRDMPTLVTAFNSAGQSEKSLEVVDYGLKLFPGASTLLAVKSRHALYMDGDLDQADALAEEMSEKNTSDYVDIKFEILLNREKQEEADRLMRDVYAKVDESDKQRFALNTISTYLDFQLADQAQRWLDLLIDRRERGYF